MEGLSGSPLLFLLSDLGTPFAIGLAVGYFVKKMVRFALFLAGMAVTLLLVGEYLGWLSLKETVLLAGAKALLEGSKGFLLFLYERLGRMALSGVSAATGFFVGLKLG